MVSCATFRLCKSIRNTWPLQGSRLGRKGISLVIRAFGGATRFRYSAFRGGRFGKRINRQTSPAIEGILADDSGAERSPSNDASEPRPSVRKTLTDRTDTPKQKEEINRRGRLAAMCFPLEGQPCFGEQFALHSAARGVVGDTTARLRGCDRFSDGCSRTEVPTGSDDCLPRAHFEDAWRRALGRIRASFVPTCS